MHRGQDNFLSFTLFIISPASWSFVLTWAQRGPWEGHWEVAGQCSEPTAGACSRCMGQDGSQKGTSLGAEYTWVESGFVRGATMDSSLCTSVLSVEWANKWVCL